MKYVFVGMMIPDNMLENLQKISSKNMQDAANALQWKIYNGLCCNLNTEITIINLLPVGSYPKNCKKPYIVRTKFKTKYCPNNINVGFNNIRLIRKISQYKTLLKEIEKWVKKTDDDKMIFVYTASAVFLKAINEIKKKYSKIKVCDIIADLPEYSSLSSNKNYMINLYVKYMAKESYKCMKSVDYFVLLTKHMADYLNIKKPYCVMEGIATKITEHEGDIDISEPRKKVIFYSGTLHKKFGVMNLLKAFSEIANKNYQLTLCGVGDCEKEIEEYAKNDSRIKFLGRISREEVLELQKKSTVLVNPRQNNEDFTKYSFPSKNLEYLSSGVPTIAYKLDGIPDEYDEYIIYINGNSINELKMKLIEICELSENERRIKGKEAIEFVNREKNEIKQTKKIVDLISN